MDAIAQIKDDLEFALDHEEFEGSMTKAMRYVAALNPKATRKMFADALAARGLNRSTAVKQFGQSRDHDAKYYGAKVEADGHISNDY